MCLCYGGAASKENFWWMRSEVFWEENILKCRKILVIKKITSKWMSHAFFSFHSIKRWRTEWSVFSRHIKRELLKSKHIIIQHQTLEHTFYSLEKPDTIPNQSNKKCVKSVWLDTYSQRLSIFLFLKTYDNLAWFIKGYSIFNLQTFRGNRTH